MHEGVSEVVGFALAQTAVQRDSLIWEATVAAAVVGAILYGLLYRHESLANARPRRLRNYRFSALGLLWWAAFGALRVFIFHA
jgi:hypothetical protein